MQIFLIVLKSGRELTSGSENGPDDRSDAGRREPEDFGRSSRAGGCFKGDGGKIHVSQVPHEAYEAISGIISK